MLTKGAFLDIDVSSNLRIKYVFWIFVSNDWLLCPMLDTVGFITSKICYLITLFTGRMLLCVRERPISDSNNHSSLQRQFSHGHSQKFEDGGSGSGTRVSHFLPTSRRIVQFSNGKVCSLCVCGEYLVFTMAIWVYYLWTYSLTWFQLVYFQQIKFASWCLLLWSSWRIGVLNMKNLLLLSYFLNCDRFFSDSREPSLAVKVGCYPWK